MKHIGKFFLLFVLIVALPILSMPTSEERSMDQLDVDFSSGPCDTHSSTLIYTWEWAQTPPRFRFWSNETINITFNGINNNNVSCITELDKENSSCTIEYYDKDGNFAANKTYSLSDESLTFPSSKRIDGKRCQAQKGVLTVAVHEFIQVDKLYTTMYKVHHVYDTPVMSEITLRHEGVFVYADGRIE